MHDIGIIGAGIGGLHLGLLLLQRGLAPTIYAALTSDEMRKARLPNTAGLLGTARDHMRQLGVAHWDAPDTGIHQFDFCIKDMPTMSYRTSMDPPCQFIDMRLYLPRLIEEFSWRGGRVVTSGSLDAESVAELGAAHDLVVVASGQGGIAEMFPRIAERSPFTEPQRRLFAALFRGMALPDPFRFTYEIVPGHGEVFDFPILTFGGPVNGLLVEAIPGGALESVTRISYDEDPRGFNLAVLELIREHVPHAFARIADPSAFEVLGARDLLQGAIVPIVRRGVVELRPNRFGLALGDAHVTHDPILGQGSNAAAKAAWLLGELLAARAEEGGAFDGDFCARVEERLWEMLQPITEWCNASLLPPPPHLMDLIAEAAQNDVIAARFVSNFDDPKSQWEVLSKPESTAAFIQRYAPWRRSPSQN